MEAWKYVVVLLWFIGSIIFFEYFLNLGNTDVTKKMSDASLPIVCMRYDNYEYNRMYGYKKEMDVSLIRDGITPLESGRIVNLRIYKYGEGINKIEYKLKSVDNSRFIEEGEITKYTESSNNIDLSLSLKDLIENKTDYSLQIILTLKSGEKAYYYARVFADDELDFHEKLEYVFNFSNATFNKDTAEAEIGKYLESNKSGDNTNFNHVNINSSLDQVTWSNLNPSVKGNVVCTVEEIDKKSAKMKLEYLVEAGADDVKTYSVKEEYRFIKGSERMYLLSFDRYMDSFVFAENGYIYGDKLMLGITDSDFKYMESEDGNTYAFVNSKSLYVVNSASNTFGSIYSFYDSKNFDERTINDNHDVNIIKVDESGNVLFYVYGYFNRGDYEGQVGIDFMEYDALLNVVEEKAFLEYSKPYEVLKNDVEILSFANENDELYVYLDDSIYKIELENGNVNAVAHNISSERLYVSASKNMIAWSNGDSDNKITFMNLEESNAFNINAGTRECVVPLGFMGEDLIYGKAFSDDVRVDVFGQILYPMNEIVIISKNQAKLKSYSQTNVYVTKCKINENLITLTRVEKNDNGDFVSISPDSIVNTQMVKVYKNTSDIIATEHLKKIVQVNLKKEMDNKKTKYLSPQTALYEGRKNISMDSEETVERYYVFVGNECLSIESSVSKAISKAEELYGCVIDSHGHYVWKKEAYNNTNQIMKIDGKQADDAESSLETCIETILEYEGYAVNVKSDLASGKTVGAILEDKIDGAEFIEIQNCSYEALKYYLNRDIPIILMAGDNSVLVTGYSDNVNVWMNPQSGNLMKVGVDEAQKLYEKYGYHFVTYIIPNS